MMELAGSWYFIWVAMVALAAIAVRRWYSGRPDRAQWVFWVMFFLLCPPLAVVVYVILKLLRVELKVQREISSHG